MSPTPMTRLTLGGERPAAPKKRPPKLGGTPGSPKAPGANNGEGPKPNTADGQTSCRTEEGMSKTLMTRLNLVGESPAVPTKFLQS